MGKDFIVAPIEGESFFGHWLTCPECGFAWGGGHKDSCPECKVEFKKEEK